MSVKINRLFIILDISRAFSAGATVMHMPSYVSVDECITNLMSLPLILSKAVLQIKIWRL